VVVPHDEASHTGSEEREIARRIIGLIFS
jgi:hypothetical protein